MSAEQARAVYLDASALVKLVLPEAESAALLEELVDEPRIVTSILGWVETRRAIHATTDEAAVLRALEGLFEQATLVELTEPVAEAAAMVQPRALRTLDAIHLATALTLGAELDAFVVYDRRLAEAAHAAGLPVRTPGR